MFQDSPQKWVSLEPLTHCVSRHVTRLMHTCFKTHPFLARQKKSRKDAGLQGQDRATDTCGGPALVIAVEPAPCHVCATTLYLFISLSLYLFIQQTEEIGLQIITTVKISTSFHGSARIYQTRFHESPNFHTSFRVCKWSPCHSKDLTRKSLDLEIQIFEV